MNGNRKGAVLVGGSGEEKGTRPLSTKRTSRVGMALSSQACQVCKDLLLRRVKSTRHSACEKLNHHIFQYSGKCEELLVSAQNQATKLHFYM